MNDDNKNAGVNKRPDIANIKIKRPPSNHIIINNNNNNVQLNKPQINHHINIKNDLYGKNNYSHQINIINNNNTPSNVQKPQPEQEKKPDSSKIRMFLAPKSSEINSKKSTNVTSNSNSNSNNNSNPSNKVVSNKEKQPQLVSKKSAPNKIITPSIKLDENKPKNPKIIDNNHNLPRNNFPSIIIVDKHPIDDYQKEEQYNQHRYFNILNQIRNEIKEDPELYFDDDDYEDEPPKPIREVSNQQEIFQGLSSNYPPPIISSAAPNAFSDFSEIESIREKLENKLGMTLLKEVINFVDSIADHKTVTFDYEKIEELKMKLEPRYSVDKINTAIDHVHEVFTIIVKERLSNSK